MCRSYGASERLSTRRSINIASLTGLKPKTFTNSSMRKRHSSVRRRHSAVWRRHSAVWRRHSAVCRRHSAHGVLRVRPVICGRPLSECPLSFFSARHASGVPEFALENEPALECADLSALSKAVTSHRTPKKSSLPRSLELNLLTR